MIGQVLIDCTCFKKFGTGFTEIDICLKEPRLMLAVKRIFLAGKLTFDGLFVKAKGFVWISLV